MVFELFQDKVPQTAENFRCLCTGEKGGVLHYKGNIFHRIIPGFMMQGGDITKQNGTGGMSIFGSKFNDEGVWLPHTTGGLLSMANSGPNTNGSQFFIMTADYPLPNSYTIFGKVVSGQDVVDKIANLQTGANDKPATPVVMQKVTAK